MNRLPVVAIVGRPNVGKSSLLNALARKRVSIVQDMPGVTRDRVSFPLPLNLGDENRPDWRYIEVVDTGGYGYHDEQGLSEHIKQQIEIAMARADVVVFVVDCDAGLTAGDQEIATLLRRTGRNTLLVANKADSEKADTSLGDFSRLGFGTPVGISAINGRNLDDLMGRLKKSYDFSAAPKDLPKPTTHIAIVGKRNAGKSTLVNAIAESYEELEFKGDPDHKPSGPRVIVSEIPGTTRDSVDVRFEKEGKTLIVIDTAGVRKKRHMVTNDIEFYSFHRAQRSIRRADVVIQLIDGTEAISEPDKKLAQYIVEQDKPVILVINKWDLVIHNAQQQAKERITDFDSELLMKEFREYMDQELKQLDYAPVAFVTAKDGKKVQAVLDLAQHLQNQAAERMSTAKLNVVVRQVLTERAPSTHNGRRAKVFYATQTAVSPPTIVLFVNNSEFMSETYQRFMINRFRELLPYPEVPIKLLLRGKPARGEGPARSLDEQPGDELKKKTATRGKSTSRGGKIGKKAMRSKRS